MDEPAILERYRRDRPIYDALGKWIRAAMRERLPAVLLPEESIETFLRVPDSPRLKTSRSLLGKALRKGYENPYDDITDKIGIRYVVLLQRQVGDVSRLIEECELWEVSRDRDFDDERRKNPTVFIYQSVHYVVRPREDVEHEGLKIPAGTPCEIQVRTLLQHAHSELTHDTTYKPKTSAGPDVHRSVAKSMALIEVAGDIFAEVDEKVNIQERWFRMMLRQLSTVYEDIAPPETDPALNYVVLDAIVDLIDDLDIDELRAFLNEKPYVPERINELRESRLLFRQPVVTLLYYLVDKQRHDLMRLWPLPEDELQPIYTHLGHAMRR